MPQGRCTRHRLKRSSCSGSPRTCWTMVRARSCPTHAISRDLRGLATQLHGEMLARSCCELFLTVVVASLAHTNSVAEFTGTSRNMQFAATPQGASTSNGRAWDGRRTTLRRWIAYSWHRAPARTAQRSAHLAASWQPDGAGVPHKSTRTHTPSPCGSNNGMDAICQRKVAVDLCVQLFVRRAAGMQVATTD